jgi:hypothetical protein
MDAKTVNRQRALDASLHRPGFRVSSARLAARDEINDAYADYERQVTSGYRNANPPPRGSQVGDPCTLNSRAGTLVEGENGKLVCRVFGPKDAAAYLGDEAFRPSIQLGECGYWSRGDDEDDEDDRDGDREFAIQQAVREMSSHHESTVRRTVPGDAMTLNEVRKGHQSIMDSQYANYDQALRNAWRSWK